jgi:xanthine dehydrogenase YagR molybdenum-binding subunit
VPYGAVYHHLPLVWRASQFVHALRGAIAKQLGMKPENVQVISRFVGGGFGSRGGPTSLTAWIAIAAKRLKRPVKLVAARDQGFTIATYRAETRHHVRLGASRDGKLQAVAHEGWEVTATTARLYASPNVWTRVNIMRADRNTPGFMRAPPEIPYLFALESAIDELAVALGRDPIELRRINGTQREPIKDLPYTSRGLMRCFDQAASAFGWPQRNLQPRRPTDPSRRQPAMSSFVMVGGGDHGLSDALLPC